MPIRISNVIGAPFQEFVTTQLANRAVIHAKKKRTINDVLFIGNKTAWVKLQSTTAFSSSVEGTNGTYFDLLQRQGAEDPQWFNKTWTKENLAAQWALQAGTSKLVQNPDTTSQGPDMVTELRSGIGYDGAYGLGGIKTQGYRPMPGLTSVMIETKGKLGSLRYATVNFKVWNMHQLDIMDALYFRLGFTMLLEWGHTQYFRDLTDDTFTTDTGGITNFYDPDVTKDDIHKAINRKVYDSRGNYDGMLGIVTNFHYTLGEDGGWDCSVKLLGMGSIMETQRINNSYKMPPGTSKLFDKLREDVLIEDIREQRKKIDEKNKEEEGKVAQENEAAKQAYEANNPVKKLDDLVKGFTGQAKADRLKLFARREGDITKENFIVAGTGNDLGYITDDATTNNRPEGTQLDEFLYYDTSKSDKKIYVPRLGDEGFINPLVVGDSTKGTSTVKIDSNTLNTFCNKLVDEGSNSDDSLLSLVSAPKASGLALVIQAGLAKVVGKDSTGASLNDILSVINDSDAEFEFGQFDRWWPVTGTVSTHVYKFSAAISGIYNSDGSAIDYTKALGRVNNYNYYADFVKGVCDAIKNFTGDHYFLLNTLEPGSLTVTYKGESTQGYDGATYTGVFKIPAPTGGLTPGKWVFLVDNGGKYVVDPNLAPAEIQVRISIKTDVTALISGIRDDKAIQTAAQKTYTPAALPPLTPSDDAINQTAKAGGFESALEAMLTIVQFYTITSQQKSKAVNAFDLLAITGQFFKETQGAMLGDLITYSLNKKGVLSPASGKVDTAYVKQKLSKATNPNRSTDPVALAIKGFNTNLMSNQVDPADVDANFDKCYPTSETEAEQMFKSLCRSYCIPYKLIDSSGQESNMLSYLHRPAYIKLGYLLMFINNLCLLYDTSKDPANSTKKIARPFYYVDYNPETNFCFTMPHQMSVDPLIAMVPFKGNNDDYKKIFVTVDPADLNNAFKNDSVFTPESSDNVSKYLRADGSSYYSPTNDPHQGRVMNILLNIDHLKTILKSTSQADGHNGVYFKPFLDAVLRDVNKALGDINMLRVGYTDASNTVAIFDDQFVPFSPKEDNFQRDRLISANRRLIVPVTGLNSLVRDFKFETNITTRMSSLIAIGASPARHGSAQATEASHIRALSQGMYDRVVTVRDEVSIAPNKIDPNKEDNNARLVVKFNDLVRNVYTVGNVDQDSIDSAKNYLIQSSADLKAGTPATNSSPVIPLNVSFTVDGISGIMMGNGFLLPDTVMPITVRSQGAKTKFGFVVTKLDHKIEANQWTTTIGGQMYKMRDLNYAMVTHAGNGADRADDYKSPTPTNVGPISTTPCPKTYTKNGEVADPGYDASSKQVTPPDYVGTDNFKTHYPSGFAFKPNPTRSDMNIAKIGLSVLKDSEIVDDTKYNLFKNGAFTSQPTHFIFHHVGGRGTSTDVYSTYYCRGYPAQFTIERDGTIHRFLPDGAIGWHIIGGSKYPGSPYPGDYSTWNNGNSIGVEIIATNDADVLPIQLNQAIRLAHYYGFKKDEVIGHGWVNWGHKEASEGLSAYKLAISL